MDNLEIYIPTFGTFEQFERLELLADFDPFDWSDWFTRQEGSVKEYEIYADGVFLTVKNMW